MARILDNRMQHCGGGVGPNAFAGPFGLPAPTHEPFVDRMMRAADERFKLGWVILRPGLFMQNVLEQAVAIRNDDKIVMPYAKDFPLAMIDVRDTAP
jgi:hypothetical protein